MQQYKNLWEQVRSNTSNLSDDDFLHMTHCMATDLTDKETAKDLVQETYKSLLITNPIDDIEKPFAYLYRAIRNKFLTHELSTKRQQLWAEEYVRRQKLNSEDDDKNANNYKKVLFLKLKQIIKSKDYELLEMLFLDNLSILEISDILQVKPKTLRNRRSLILSKLKSEQIVFIVVCSPILNLI